MMVPIKTKVICTIGPASLKPRVIGRLQALGVSLFRINLSHTPLEQVRPAVAFLQEHATVPISLDSEGAQVRTGVFSAAPTNLRKGSLIQVHRHPVSGDAQKFNFTPPATLELLELGDLVTIDFHAVEAEVMELQSERAVLRIRKGGRVGSNKACNVHREIDLPAITVKDRKAIEIGREMGVEHFALSFANRPEDARQMRELIGPAATLTSKIESRSGIANLEEIARLSDAILIDRGDLSRQVPLEEIPACQKDIIRRVKAIGRPVYVATNLLESMVHSPVPTASFSQPKPPWAGILSNVSPWLCGLSPSSNATGRGAKGGSANRAASGWRETIRVQSFPRNQTARVEHGCLECDRVRLIRVP
jgi:pyruvate kinase